MNFYAVSALVNVATSVVLGPLVLFAGWRNRINQLFALFALSVAVWSYSYFMWQIAPDAQTAFVWTHALMAGAIWIPFFYFHFVVRFLELMQRMRIFVWLGYVTAATFSVINWGPFFISAIHSEGGFMFWPVAGPLFLPFLGIWVFYAFWPVGLLFNRFRNSEGERYAQLRFILIGTIVGYLGGSTNYFLWYGIPVPPIGNITASAYLVLVAYATLKHGLFSMKVVATEFIVFSLWLFVFIRMLVASSGNEQFVDAGLLFVLLIIGTLLIRSVDREVEQRKRIEQLAHDLEETNARQEGLLHFIGHEVKGFMAKDEGAFAAMVDGDFGVLPDGLKPFAEQALTQARNGVRSVTDILMAANQKKGTIAYQKESFDLKALAEEVVRKERPMAEEKKLALSFAADDGSYSFTGDKAKIEDNVLRNLVENAIFYTPTGSVTVTLAKGQGRYIFRVQDTGIGITDEDKARLFTEGGHGKDSQRVNAHSTGYGLYIAKNVVEAHGGTLKAESAGAGKGSTFTVELPAN